MGYFSEIDAEFFYMEEFVGQLCGECAINDVEGDFEQVFEIKQDDTYYSPENQAYILKSVNELR